MHRTGIQLGDRHIRGNVRHLAALSHTNGDGKAVMVDISKKADTHRIATARGSVHFSLEQSFKLLQQNAIAKGDVLTVAKIAGINAAKQAAMLIPLAHPINLTKIDVDLRLNSEQRSVDISATAECVGKTGVEVEAMTAVSIAACTVFDMCKAVDKKLCVSDIRVVYKTGGASGTLKS